jgi:hypothetical protein
MLPRGAAPIPRFRQAVHDDAELEPAGLAVCSVGLA